MSISDHGLKPYNGTVFSLTGEVQLNISVVNTDITVLWVWSHGGRTLKTASTTSPSPHRLTIEFIPLATNSSGRYHLNMTVVPVDNAEYVIGNSDSGTSYDLVVESKSRSINGS